MEYADKPDYNLLVSIFERCIQRRGIQSNDPYDWEKPLPSNEVLSTTKSLPTVTIPPAITSATTINRFSATPQVDTADQENVEPDNKKELDVRKITVNCYLFWNNIKNLFFIRLYWIMIVFTKKI